MSKAARYQGFSIAIQSWVEEESGDMLYRFVIYRDKPQMTDIKSEVIYSAPEEAESAAHIRIDHIIANRSQGPTP